MRRHTSHVVVTAFLSLLPTALLAQGSNLGAYATQLDPGVIAGTVTLGGTAVAGARVETTAGQFTYTAADGSYLLRVDAPGIYDVKVWSSALGRGGPVQVSVTLGATTRQDFTSLVMPPRPRRSLPGKRP